jgi:hypothetical protein
LNASYLAVVKDAKERPEQEIALFRKLAKKLEEERKKIEEERARFEEERKKMEEERKKFNNMLKDERKFQQERQLIEVERQRLDEERKRFNQVRLRKRRTHCEFELTAPTYRAQSFHMLLRSQFWHAPQQSPHPNPLLFQFLCLRQRFPALQPTKPPKFHGGFRKLDIVNTQTSSYHPDMTHCRFGFELFTRSSFFRFPRTVIV